MQHCIFDVSERKKSSCTQHQHGDYDKNPSTSTPNLITRVFMIGKVANQHFSSDKANLAKPISSYCYCSHLILLNDFFFLFDWRGNISHNIHERRSCSINKSATLPSHPKPVLSLFFYLLARPLASQQMYVGTVWMNACHRQCVSGCAPCCTESSTQADIHLTDIRGDSSTVAYGNRLLTAKT